MKDKIYPSMVIRTQAEAIELLEKELEQLKEIEKEHQRINGNLREEIKELKYKINNLILFAYGTEMSLGEFKGIFKLAFDKEHNPKIPIEKQVGGKQ